MARRQQRPSYAPVRVVTMIDSLLAGGAERVAVELSCALDRARFEPSVLVTRGDGPLRELLDAAGVPVTFLDRAGAYDVGPWLRAHKLVRRDAELMHAHKFGSNIWAAALSRTTRVPFIAHEHNFSETPTAKRRVLDRAWIGTRAARVLCVSDSVAEVERACGVPERRIETVPNGVRLDAALPRHVARGELGLAQHALVVGIVGRLRPEKAHEVLFTAIARLVQRGRPVHVCVIGDGPRRDELLQMASQLGIGMHVTWAGERRDAARLASAFDIGVVCSHWEGLPLAALETMAAGVPLVATTVGGLPTLLAGGAGMLVPPNDPDALASALDRLMVDPQGRVTLGHAGRQRVALAYSFESMVGRVQQIYERVLAERGRSSQHDIRYRDAAHRAGARHPNDEEAA